MTDSWWKKLLNSSETQDNTDWDYLERISTPNKVRIGESNRPVHVRMLNQYPKTPMKEEKLLIEKNESYDSNDNTKEVHTENPKKFVPTVIPSPVFGYNRHVKESVVEDLSVPTYQRKADVDEQLGREAIIEDRRYEHANDESLVTENELENGILSEQNSIPINLEHDYGTETENDDEQRQSTKNVTKSNQIKGKSAPLTTKSIKTNEVSVNQQQQQTRSTKRDGTTRLPYNVLMNPPKRYINQIKEEKREQNNISKQKITTETPTLDLLSAPQVTDFNDEAWCHEKEEVLKQTLINFNVKGDIVEIVQGPTVTRFELKLKPGVKVNKIIGLTEDIKLSLAARQVRIAPVPGKNTVGIEIPNEKRKPVYLKQLLLSEVYQTSHSPLTAALGRDVSGKTIVTDLAKMPHGLIAGATGSGKSVCIHSLILSLIYKSTPADLRLILIDPKVVELAAYQKLPHLAAPVLTQPKEASLALKWAVDEMENRYQVFAKNGVRDISRYNHDVKMNKISAEKMPYIVIIIDELADLMMVSPQDVEEAICRIAQKARAAGIHLILATQRPSVDVITGLIKSNIPTRIAFSVSSQADSRTILDSGGADRLLGQGDMLFSENGARSLKRVQGCFVSDEEIDRVTETLSTYDAPPYLFDKEQLTKQAVLPDEEEDALFEEVGYFVIDQGQASISSVQRRFRIGYNRAARLIDQMERYDMISEANGSKPRQVIISKEVFQHQILGNDLV